MTLSLFDLHCDTAYEMRKAASSLKQNGLEISLEKAAAFFQYIQVMALWTPPSLSNEVGWKALLDTYANLLSDPSVKSGEARPCTVCPTRGEGVSLLLSIEDARVLNQRLDRVDTLADMGVRIATLLWSGESCMGGAHDTTVGLSPFGLQAARRLLDRGITLDLSHASLQSAEDMLLLAEQAHAPVIASHSNAFGICPVSRNLRDWQIRAITDCGGLIGLNLHKHFLSNRQPACPDDLRRHIDYFLERGARDSLCFGCDMDGGELPPFIPDLSAFPSLVEYLLSYYSEELIRDLLFENAFHFAERHWSPSAKK